MKRNIIKYALVIFAVVSVNVGCKNEEDDLFDKSAAQRIDEYMTTYTDNLISANNGWVMEYFLPDYPGTLICAKFNRDQSVETTTYNPDDPDRLLSGTSVWEIIADKGPVLSFITYNECIHYFADPAIDEELLGKGYEGDYEFSIINCEKNAESALLKGKKNQIYINLQRLPSGISQEEYLNDVSAFRNSIMSDDAQNENMMLVGDSLFYIQDIASGNPNFYRANGDPIADESYFDYLITKHTDGNYYLRFRDPVVMCVTNEMKDIVVDNNVVSKMVTNSFLIEEKNVTPEIKEMATHISEPMQVFKYSDRKFVSIENPKACIFGHVATSFFPEYMEDDVTFTADTTQMSEPFKKEIRNIYSEICSKTTDQYDIVGLTLKKRKEIVTMEITFTITPKKGRKTTQAWSYHYSCDFKNDLLNLKYIEPSTASDANKLTLFPSILNLFELLSDSYSYDFVKPFDVNETQFVSKTHPENSFVFKIKK